jgi:hypothetical protein
MSQPSDKNRKVKPRKLKLVARNPGKIKAALRSWVKASDKVEADPLGLDNAPQWVENAWIEVTKCVMPGRRMPSGGELNMETLGGFFGRLQAFTKLYQGEIPVTPAVEEEAKQLVEEAARAPKPPGHKARLKKMTRDFSNRLDATEQKIPQIMAAVYASSHEDALIFQKAYLAGLNIQPHELETPVAFQRHTKIFGYLARHWKRFAKCQSVADVYYDLCETLGFKEVGSLKTFEERIARKIGMKFRGRGRPKGT